jgi:hypothetical protein
MGLSSWLRRALSGTTPVTALRRNGSGSPAHGEAEELTGRNEKVSYSRENSFPAFPHCLLTDKTAGEERQQREAPPQHHPREILKRSGIPLAPGLRARRNSVFMRNERLDDPMQRMHAAGQGV